jgi:mRNA interferase MazF
MMRHSVIYNQFDIVKVPFPFTDKQTTKTRPALVLSSHEAFNEKVGHSVIAMFTSAKHSALIIV